MLAVSLCHGNSTWLMLSWLSAGKWSKGVCQFIHTDKESLTQKVTAMIDLSDVLYDNLCVSVSVCVLRVTSRGAACQDGALAWSPSLCKASQSWRGFDSRMWPSGGCSGIVTSAATSPSLNVLIHTLTHLCHISTAWYCLTFRKVVDITWYYLL